jgi:DNA mismatch repair ATPase MutL
LFLEVDPATIDVNVHPSKREVKLTHESELFGFLNTAVKAGLAGIAEAPVKAKAAVTTKCDASGASATAALTGSFCMGMTLEESTGDDDLALIDVHPSGALPGTLA